VNLQDAAGPRVLTALYRPFELWAQVILYRFAHAGRRHAGGDVGCDWSEDVAALERAADGLAKVTVGRDQADLMLLVPVDHRQHFVIGRYEILTGGFHQDGAAKAADPRVYHHDVHRPWRKMTIRLCDQVRSLGDFKWCHVVRDVGNLRARAD